MPHWSTLQAVSPMDYYFCKQRDMRLIIFLSFVKLNTYAQYTELRNTLSLPRKNIWVL